MNSRNFTHLLAICAVTSSSLSWSAARADDAPDMQTVTIGGDQYRVRSGYTLTQIAGPDLISRPTVGDWDDQGRLVVCESSGTHESTEDQLKSEPHKLVRLIDEDEDGVFDRRLVAAEGLSFYSGVLCDGDDIYVSTPPSILKLTDADGDGVCESREVWHDGGTITYCANDLHGPYKGPDGWIYWCKGAFGEQTHELAGGKTLVSKAAHVLRKRPEGGPVEIVISGGMDNPTELAWLPSGDLFFTSTFLHHPSGGVRDGIGHAVYGSLFGKHHSVIDGHPRTGDLMPVMTELGAAAPSGLTRLAIAHPKENVLACAQFNLHKVSRHRLRRRGATFESIDEDLVMSDRLTFHPTDVIEDKDGSLVFLDTGDWYDLCCPSSGAEASKATGGVFRLTRVAPGPVQTLADVSELVDSQVAEFNRLSRSVSPDLSMATKAVKESAHPAIVRAAAECLGHHGNASHVDLLFERLNDASSHRVLEHSLLYAALQIGDVPAIESFARADLVETEPVRLRAAILLLDQLDAGRLDPALVFAAACSDHDRLRAAASESLARHSDWAERLLPDLADRWSMGSHDPVILDVVSDWQSRGSVRDWVLGQMTGPTAIERRVDLLSRMSFDELSIDWNTAIDSLLEASPDREQMRIARWLAGVSLSPKQEGVVSRLLVMLSDPRRSVAERLQLAAVLPDEMRPDVHGVSKMVVETLLESTDLEEQRAAQAALKRIRLDVQDAGRLMSDLESIPTARLTAAVGAIAAADESLSKELLRRLPDVPASRTLSPEVLVSFYAGRRPSLRAEAKRVADRLSAPPQDIVDSLQRLIAELPEGDMVRGMRVFHGAKAACGQCHEFGDVGGRVGPELTGIGKSRSGLALLEAIVYPSSHIAQGYRSVKVLTLDGVVHTGLVTRETNDLLELTTGIDRVVKIRKGDIEERTESDVSLMPAGLDGSMSKQDLADVLELLQVYSAW